MPLSHFVSAIPSLSLCPQVHSLHLHLYSCPGRWILNHCATREVPLWILFLWKTLHCDSPQHCSCPNSQWLQFHIDNLPNTHLLEFLSHFSEFLASNDLVLHLHSLQWCLHNHAPSLTYSDSNIFWSHHNIQLIDYTNFSPSLGNFMSSLPSWPGLNSTAYYHNHSLTHILHCLDPLMFCSTIWVKPFSG